MDNIFNIENCPYCGEGVSIILRPLEKKTAQMDIDVVCAKCRQGYSFKKKVAEKDSVTGKRAITYKGIAKGLNKAVESWNIKADITKRKDEVKQLE